MLPVEVSEHDVLSAPLIQDDSISTSSLLNDIGEGICENRLERWKAKLLDLTLRNRLIHFRPSKTTIKLNISASKPLKEGLHVGEEWCFRALIKEGTCHASDFNSPLTEEKLKETESMSYHSDAFFTENEGKITSENTLDHPVYDELCVDLDEQALATRLHDVYNAMRLGLEEGGANVLYLAIGFLRWADNQQTVKTYLAPICLVPVYLNRQSVRTGYRLKRYDDEWFINPTLLELLHQKFGLSLFDEEGWDTKENDVFKVLDKVQSIIEPIPYWKVEKHAYLGIFSFTKFLMWKDLQERTVHLKQHRIVRSLIEGAYSAQVSTVELANRDDLDERHVPEALLTPLLADSSQLNAVSRAEQGYDFVLEGPPGTGKSQTIANLIAHCLGQGRTVLFVSEKMAALDVVKRRLDSIGLSPFCLELHSVKTRKVEVLQQFRMAIEAGRVRTSEGWTREADRLAALRTELNSVVWALHSVHPNGLSVYQAINTVIRYRAWVPASIPWKEAGIHVCDRLDVLRELVRNTQAIIGEMGTLVHHPLSGIRHAMWSHDWEGRFSLALTDLSHVSEQLQRSWQAVAGLLKFSVCLPTALILEGVDQLTDRLLGAYRVPVEVISPALDVKVRFRLAQVRAYGQQRQQFWDVLKKWFKPDITRLNADELEMQWSQACASWWPVRVFKQRAIAHRLALYGHQSQPLELHLIPEWLSALRKVNDADRFLQENEVQSMEWLGAMYCGCDTDWEQVQYIEEWGQQLEQDILRLQGLCHDSVSGLKTTVVECITKHRDVLSPDQHLGQMLLSYREQLSLFHSCIQTMTTLAASEDFFERLLNVGTENGSNRFSALAEQWSRHRNSLKLWCAWQHLRTQLLDAGLDSFVDILEAGGIPVAHLTDYFEYSYQSWWLKTVVDREPLLRTFSGANHERKISDFRQVDKRFQHLTEQIIIARLAQRIANLEVSEKPDVERSLLLRELAKQRAHLSVRKLIQGIPTLLPRLKPCLLMSPLSVAQYLDVVQTEFDVVIFDEASQIAVWDAVGAISRGRQLIMVGDPKQLPPTRFFDRSEEIEEFDATDASTFQDLESILDECVGIGMPVLRLEWHYRSQHESLITFSNYQYYQSRLVTFPSPVLKDCAVSCSYIGGEYDRAGSRTNRAEAEAIIQAIITHFHDRERQKLTLGVVTFNQPQQRLIEILLEEAMKASPELESRIQVHGAERLFIKNLENVQGDERDIILFSITYGKDAAGKLPMNFGPLNQAGGERRLNVAVTRARVGINLFCSIFPEEIDIARTAATGVRDLKTYLEFASKGTKALLAQVVPTHRLPESPFETEVIQALQNSGWIVHAQVGCSDYRIDMAVVHPDKPGLYILGIECDGAVYHSLPTARDRDRLRQSILEGLGWTLHRIWSTDWWMNPQRELEKLETVLRRQLEMHDSTANFALE